MIITRSEGRLSIDREFKISPLVGSLFTIDLSKDLVNKR